MAKRKEIKWRREGRGTMTGRQDGIIFGFITPGTCRNENTP